MRARALAVIDFEEAQASERACTLFDYLPQARERVNGFCASARRESLGSFFFGKRECEVMGMGEWLVRARALIFIKVYGVTCENNCNVFEVVPGVEI